MFMTGVLCTVCGAQVYFTFFEYPLVRSRFCFEKLNNLPEIVYYVQFILNSTLPQS